MKNITILAHRGFWLDASEKNSKIAFIRAFDNGFGIETDLRDCNGEIVISHDMPKGDEMSFDELMRILDGRDLPLALNIKADGMGEKIKEILEKYNHTNYFTFDMSIPEMVVQNRLGLRFFTGKSDIIKEPIMLKESSGVWLDSFKSDWFDESEITRILEQNKQICIVSPDLHKREYESVWQKYKNAKNIMLCTDYPIQAREFFNV